jgi:hypothetical protein
MSDSLPVERRRFCYYGSVGHLVGRYKKIKKFDLRSVGTGLRAKDATRQGDYQKKGCFPRAKSSKFKSDKKEAWKD